MSEQAWRQEERKLQALLRIADAQERIADSLENIVLEMGRHYVPAGGYQGGGGGGGGRPL